MAVSLCEAYHEKLREFHPDKRPESRGETGGRVRGSDKSFRRVCWWEECGAWDCMCQSRSHKRCWMLGPCCRRRVQHTMQHDARRGDP